MDVETALPLSPKEGEAIMWGCAQIGDYIGQDVGDPTDPRFILLNAGWSREAIKTACEGLEEVACGTTLGPAYTPLEQAILRCCVENTSWIDAYRSNEPTKNSPACINQALAALRSLAGKLETLGIDINHIPFN